MKRFISVLLAVAVLLTVGFTTAYAAKAEVFAVVDYENDIIDITYKSNLDYNTDVIVYMLKSEQAFEDVASSIRTVQSYVKAEESAQLSVILGDDIAEGDYKFYAVAGGKDSHLSVATSDAIYILGKQKQIDILDDINDADSGSISNVVYTGISSVFNFKETTAPSWKGEYIASIRDEDFAGNFTSLNQVYNAWLMSDVLLSVNNADTTTLGQVLELNSDVLGIDVTNEDYVKYSDEVHRILDYLISQNKLLSKTDAINAFDESVAVACVNESSVEELGGIFLKYADTLDISDSIDEYQKYNALNFARQFGEFSANSASEVKIKFINTLNSFENTVTVVGTPGGSGGSSGGGFGGGASVVIEPQDGTQTVTNQKRFSDVPESYWASEPVYALAQMGIINGYSDNTFRGENKVAREEFAKMLVSAFDLKAVEDAAVDFDDVGIDHWSYEYIKTAFSLGIVKGTDENSFGTGSAITRADMAVMLDRAMQAVGYANRGNENISFTDEQNIPAYAKDSVQKLTALGIINGFSDGSFKPDESLTRAQAAKVIFMVLTGK